MKNTSLNQHTLIDLFGTVQAVGMRPALYRWANKNGLTGSIQNMGDRVRLKLSGTPTQLYRFQRELDENLPPLASVEKIRFQNLLPVNVNELCILPSQVEKSIHQTYPPDIATCDECWNDYKNPTSRYYRYPFVSCSHCGPRFSVIEGLPYDRSKTTLKEFPLCDSCQKEFSNPNDRRFHAECLCCSDCGPRAWPYDGKSEIPMKDYNHLARELGDRLKSGQIVAFRGIGGFALVCDAADNETIKKLRERKNRPHQSLALMGKDINALAKWVDLNPDVEKKLLATDRPIVIAPKAASYSNEKMIAPDTTTFGVMLPTSPLQQLLFEYGPDTVVYTSGNHHQAPMCKDNVEALNTLSDVADIFLLHDRDISNSVDDSLVSTGNKTDQTWRMARGRAPIKIKPPVASDKTILALGADMKNALALQVGGSIVMGSFNGGLDEAEAYKKFQETSQIFCTFYDCKPDILVIDKHNGYLSHQWGHELAKKWNCEVIEIQHHHAHAVTVMAEHGLESALNLVFDGTGFGDDGHLWGGELLLVTNGHYDQFRRVDHFPWARLPGGTSAIIHPARQCLWRLHHAGINYESFLNVWEISHKDAADLLELAKKDINSPRTSSVGRLFDAVAAFLNLAPNQITYEAQAAIILEKSASQYSGESLRPYSLNETEMWREMLDDLNSIDTNAIAWRFHRTIAEHALKMVQKAQHKYGKLPVTLSGGVFHNQLLLQMIFNLFEENGIKPHAPENLPAGDGALAYGQCTIASSEWEARHA